MRETRVPSPGREDPLEKEMVIHSSSLAWRIPGTGEPGGMPSMGLQSRTRLKQLSSSSSILSCCLFSLTCKLHHAKCQVEAQAAIKIAGRNISNLRYSDDTTFMSESKEELKSHLMKVKEESEKARLKLNIQKMKIMTSSTITSWQIDGETVETVTELFSWAPKSMQMVTAAMKLKDACSLEGKLRPT